MGRVFSHKKQILLGIIFILLLVTMEKRVGAQNGGTETISKENYTFEISHESEQIRRPIHGSQVTCGSFGAQVTSEVSDGFGMTISDEILQEILMDLEVEFGLDTEVAKLKAKMDLRNKLLSESRFFRDRKIIVKVTKTIPIEEMDCYNQQAYIVYEKEKYKVKTTKSKWLKDKYFEFDWEEHTDFSIIVEVKYDEDCDCKCQIEGKDRPVLGKDGEPLWAYIPHKKKLIYVVPLYWGKDGKIIDYVLLPE